MAYEYIHFQETEAVARITLNRPPLNILTTVMMQEIHSALTVAASAPKRRAIVFDANGRAFSAGVDVGEHTAEKVQAMLEAFHAIFRTLAEVDVPTVAIVHGPALGGGCELVMMCDFVLAGRSATFGQPEIKVGVFPPVAAVSLPSLVGMRQALRLVLLGEVIGAEEAERLGLVTRAVPDESLREEGEKLIAALVNLSAPVLRLAKRATLRPFRQVFPRSLEEVERLYLQDLMVTRDAQEGLAAFLEKRQPAWRHE
jgi:cyclohexa-1,5-dienecarbonyl-CoA hydratase